MALSLTLLAASQFLKLVAAAAPYCLPGDPCYPSEQVWNDFNGTVGGRLIKVEPYGSACYASTYDEVACKALAEIKGNLDYRQDLPAGVMYTNWEQDDDLSGCPVPDLKEDGSAPDPVEADCTLGAMSHYVLNATSADHAAEAVKFAAKNNLRFRIKNTGHDYTGRSTGAGSFSLWTHYMNDATFLKGFVPEDTSAEPHDVISAGPAVDVLGLYEAGAKNGVVTIGGYTPSVGAAGGYVLGGGTGPFGPLFGLGVDNVVQFEVVMADGSQQIANEKVNSDLFWALRGGGGTFAVTTRVYIKAYPAFKAVNVVAGQIVCQDNSSFSELISAMVELQLPLREAGQTGIWESSSPDVAIVSIDWFTDAVKTPNETLAAFEPALTVPGCEPQISAAQFNGSTSWFDAYQAAVVPTIAPGGAVGVNLADLSRMISYDLINDQAGRDSIKQYIIETPAPFIWQNVVGEATRAVSPDATSVHPDWRNAFAFMDSPIFGPWSGITSEQLATVNATEESLTEVFGLAAYYNEQFPTNENWQGMQFGSNYARLLKIKNAVDPNGVFSCRNCVGSEGGF